MTSTENNIEIPTKTGYIFDGYYTSLDENGVKFIDGNGYITDDANTSNFLGNGSLFAKWKYDYKIIDGEDQTHEEKDGKDISVKTNGDNSKFVELQVDGEKVKVEIQVRTIAMDMWAIIERNLRSKPMSGEQRQKELRCI